MRCRFAACHRAWPCWGLLGTDGSARGDRIMAFKMGSVIRIPIEGDIKGCLDNIDHTVLLSILGEKIHDNRFLRLIENMLQAGYLEQWDLKPTLSGMQGGII